MIKWAAAVLPIIPLLSFAVPSNGAEKLKGTINNRPILCYRIADVEAAKQEAKAANKPIMWIASKPEFLTTVTSMKGSGSGHATIHALAAFADRCVLVFQDAYAENHQGPPIVDQALHTPNPHYTPPSVVLLDSGVKRVLKVITYEENFDSRKETFKNAILELPKLMATEEKKP